MSNNKQSSRDGFGLGIVEAAHQHPEIVALCADLTDSMRLTDFHSQFPQRFYEVGVAEQNLAGLAAGMALAGKKPFAASYAVFHPGNSWGVIRASIAYSDLPVVLVGGHVGLGTGPDGATHQALEDIALMRSLPNMAVITPSDAEQARQAVHALVQYPHPAYLRLSRYATHPVRPEVPFSLDTPRKLREGAAGVVLSYGDITAHVWDALESLPPELQPELYDVPVIKPFPKSWLLQRVQQAPRVIVVENHHQTGGLSELVGLSLVESQYKGHFAYRCVTDEFGESGTPDDLFEHHNLSTPALATFFAEHLAKV